jgi:phosphoserine aminotransferase
MSKIVTFLLAAPICQESETTMTDRVYNFSPGPAVLPMPVLEQAQRDLLALPGAGASILEISHRSKAFEGILADAKSRLKALLGIPDNYHILFLQGGARLQFSMIPMNLLRGAGAAAEYVVTGSWSKYALEEAKKEGPVTVAWNGKETNYDRLPSLRSLDINPQAAYAYIASNETIQGIQFATDPDTSDVPWICDASSDFLHRPVDVSRYGILFACAQKNAGPAGVTIVIIRDDLLARGQDTLPGYLNYRLHVENNSLWNTPPVFGIYVFGLIARWLQDEIGGLDKMYALNGQKAQMLYEVIDASQGFYRGHAQPDCRSVMNVTFRLPSEELEKKFLAEAVKLKLCDLKGHRSVGGMRASIYNAMPLEGVRVLRDFMRDFSASNSV